MDNMVICISRQFGSGGHELGKRLAEELGIEFYDKELLQKAAEKSGIVEELFERADEKPTGSLLYSLSAMGVSSKAPSFNDYTPYLPNDRLQNIIAEVIRDLAAKAPCVIIGRCADYILRGNPRRLSVFVHAPLEQRVQRVAMKHNLDEDGARSLVRKTDRSRANYYSFYTDREWNDAAGYDLAVDAGRLGINKSVDLIKEAAKLFCE